MKSKILIPCYLLLLFPFISWSQIGHTAYIFDNLGNNLSTAQTYCQSNFPGNTSIYSVPNEVLIEVGKIYEYTDGSNTVFYAVVGIKSTSPKFGTPILGGDWTFPDVCSSVSAPAPVLYQAPSLSNENYVFTRTYHKEKGSAVTTSDSAKTVIESVSYFDGLGRAKQQVAIGASPDGSDLVTHIDYDDYGRAAKEWLTFKETGTRGSYRSSNIEQDTKDFYDMMFPDDFGSTINPYSEKQFEASPLSRVDKQAKPGEDWKLGGGHEIEFARGVNTTNEVRLFTVSLSGDYSPSLSMNGYYQPAELYKSTTRDENHTGSSNNYTTEEFTDKQGRVVLKRTHNNGDHDTYYVYDDYGNLTYVIPPLAIEDGSVSSSDLKELCYQYKYDNRNRLIAKKLPGKGASSTDWEEIVYTKLDQPAMTRDPNLKTQSKWLFTKYDAFGRVAYTGKWSGTSSHSSLQNTFDGASVHIEQRQTSAATYSSENTQVYYSNNAKPQNINEVLTINYYDTYLPSNAQGYMALPTNNTNSLGDIINPNAKGLPTVTRTKILGQSNKWVTTTTAYNDKGQAVWVKTYNDLLQTTDLVEYNLEFDGKVLKSKTTHIRPGNDTITMTDFFKYDHMGRQIEHSQVINNENRELIAKNSYDALGQLVSKKVGGTYTGNGLQTVDYTYNVRGWLRQINDPSSLGSDLFAFGISYNDTDHGASALFNGNISETEWITANDNTNRYYKYTYDALNRLTEADGGFGYDVNSISYDKNGNLKTLKRYEGTSTLIDNLSYNYLTGSNKLNSVGDASNNSKGFRNWNTSTDYAYDANGNMTKDLNKGINTNGISYNHLNLPESINVSLNRGDGTGTFSYIYDATGIKIRKTVQNVTTDYDGNFIYKGGALQYIFTPEGYIEPSGLGFDYIYQYKDHLGNVRLSYKNTGTASSPNLSIEDENNYYPFGLEHEGYNDGVSGTENQYKYNSKEKEELLGLNSYDYGARNYDPTIGRWMSIDPLSEIYHTDSPYAYVLNNPINFIDPDGRQVIGVTEDDAEKVHEDLNSVFAGEKFSALRALFTRGKKNKSKTFDKIDGDALKDALVGLEGDDLALAETVAGAINSDAKHKVEYASIDGEVSKEGTSSVKEHMNNVQAGFGNAMFTSENAKATLIEALGGAGFNVPTEGGSHSIIIEGENVKQSGGNRAVTSFHEIFGHGIPSANKSSATINNINAIRTDNLVRRILNIKDQRDGSNHAGGKIENPSALPTVKN